MQRVVGSAIAAAVAVGFTVAPPTVSAFSFRSNKKSENTPKVVEKPKQPNPADFIGRYKLTRSDDNFGPFLSAAGVGRLKRLVMERCGVECRIDHDPSTGQYTLRTITSFSDLSIVFRAGERFEEQRADGAKVWSVMQVEDRTWTQVQYSQPQVTIVRHFSPEGVECHSTAGEVTTVRFYERINQE